MSEVIASVNCRNDEIIYRAESSLFVLFPMRHTVSQVFRLTFAAAPTSITIYKYNIKITSYNSYCLFTEKLIGNNVSSVQFFHSHSQKTCKSGECETLWKQSLCIQTTTQMAKII